MKKIFMFLIITFIFLFLLYKINKNLVITNILSNAKLNASQVVEKLREKFNNDDIKGVLINQEINLNTIILQGKDNDYYMNHAVTKKFDKNGSIFLDYRNSIDSKKILIYGHNSNYLKTDFNNLEKYLEEEFAKNNPYIYLNLYGEESIWQIFSIMIVPNTTTKHTVIEFSNEYEFLKHIDWILNNSIIKFDVEIDFNDNLMTLQTCYYKPKNSLLLINFKKLEGNNV